MTLSTSGHHTRVVALGGIEKRRGSHHDPSFHFREILLAKIATNGHQAMEVSFDHHLGRKRMNIKGINGLGNIASMTHIAHPP
jgi:hypothetical protein